ncbi:hypothetical protein MMA231_04186 (plasmid) [Asticcacaulis sp. MM231]|uniref:sterol desaturase family protein n=1 Tax=Asticcacaulis sp. MM231 TaxID=3157666 RepID=UPI0032D5AF04
MLEFLKSYISGISLTHLPMFAIAWCFLFAAAIASYGYQYYLVRKDLSFFGFLKHCFPLHTWRDKSSYIDIMMYFVSKYTKAIVLLGHIALVLLVSGGVNAILGVVFEGYVAQTAGVITIIVFSALSCVVWDFSNFLSHYLQHKVPFLWEIHKVHHSATQLTPFTSKRLHPLADKLDLTIGGVLVGILFGFGQHIYDFSVADMVIMLGNMNMIVTIAVMDPLRHSQFPISFGPLEAIFISPRMHHLHHSVKLEHWDKNMGFALAIWDRMFGTYCRAKTGEAYVYGIGRGADVDLEYQSVYGAYVHPVVKSIKVLTGVEAPQPMPELPNDAYDGAVPLSASMTAREVVQRLRRRRLHFG